MAKVGSFLKGALAGAALAVCCHQAAFAEIPARYAPLDWVELSGAQWINTQYVPLCTDVLEMKLRFTTLAGTHCLYCARGITTDANTLTAFILSGNLRFDRYSKAGTSTFKAEADIDYTVVANAGTLACTVNGEEAGTMPMAGDFTPASPLTLFASHTSGMSLNDGSVMGNWATYRFYHFRVYSASGKLVREFVPVIDLEAADARVCCGLYETQKGTFHQNLGTRAFKRASWSGSSDIVLEKNEVWDEVGVERYGKQIDLNGFNLHLRAIDMPLAVTNSSETTSELCLELADSVNNDILDVQGNVKLVKEGAGTYSSALNNQLFTGGIDIREGQVLSTASGTSLRMGESGGEIVVGAGATLDVSNTIDHNNYRFVLNGGTLTSSANVGNAWTKAMVADVRLGADSTIETSGVYGIINHSYEPASIDLGGHALTITPGTYFYFANVVTTAGTLVLNGTYEFYREPSDFRASDVVVNGQLRVNTNAGTILFGNCVFNTPSADASTVHVGPISVYGALRPNTDFFHGCEMQNGSTLDLRGRSAPFRTKGKNVGTTDAMTTITFAADATVTVNVAGRELEAGVCLVEWDTPPADTTTFVFDAETAALGFTPAVTATGLYCSGAGNSYPAKAVWTGAAGSGDLANPANWSCENFAGTVLPNVLPRELTVVAFSGDVAPQIPPGASFPNLRLTFDNARLSADCDWRGLGAAVIGGSLDLNGHTLRVAGLDGDGAITQTFDLTKPEPARATSTTTFYNGVAANLFSNNFERQVDSEHRVICLYANLPLVAVYDFDEETLVNAYKIHVGPIADAELQRSPTAWTFSGSDDGENWTVLDERTSETGWVGWECRTFTFENETAYRFYRLSITDSVQPSNGYVEFVQLEYGLAEPGPGTLCVEVPAGETAELNARVDGHVRLVKEGAGELVAKKARQTYNMGTDIVEGNVRFGTGDAPLGRGRVKLCEGTRLDADTFYSLNYGVYNYDLAGTLAITNGAAMNTFKFGNITLSGDATILGSTRDTYFSRNGQVPGMLALNGHTLTFSSAGFVALGKWLDDGSGGRIVFDGPAGTCFETTGGGNPGPATADVRVTGGAILREASDYNFGDFTYDGATWQLTASACTLSVHGLFRPGEMYPALTMRGGSTLDLSQQTGTWNADGIAAVAGSGNPRICEAPGLVSFETNATVTVDVHGRMFEVGEKIISWPRKPEGTTFVFDEATAAAGVAPVAGETGLFYGSGGAVEVATWTGSALDGDLANPENWFCLDAAGQNVAGGVPNESTIVHVGGATTLQVPAADAIPCAKVVFDKCTLAADCDLRGLDLSNAEGEIDLAGRKLYVSNLGGPLSISDNRGYELLGGLAVASGAWVNTGYTPSCTDRTQVKVRVANTSNNKNIYCARTKAGNNFLYTFSLFCIGNKFRFDRNTTTVDASPTISTSTDYELAADGFTLKGTVNGGSAVNLPGGDFTPGSAFVLFASHTTGPGVGVDNRFVGTFYYFRVYDKDGALKCECLPARRLSDGAVGIIETVSGRWLQNSGGGSLTASGNVVGMWGQDPSELHIDVPEGVVVENTATSITGDIKLFKEGAGELVGYVQEQWYGGGTVVEAGTLRPRTAIANNLTYYEAQHYWGGEGTTIEVNAGGTLDVAGHYAYRVHPIVLNGGTIVNSGPDQTNTNWGGVGNLTLTADSTLDLQCSASVYCVGTKVNLGGHKLTVRLGDGKTFWVGNAFENGTIEVTGSGWMRPCGTMTSFNCGTADLVLRDGAALWLGYNLTVHSITMGATDNVSRGIYPVTVLDTCRPEGDSFYGCSLEPGATIDLSALAGELPVRSPSTRGSDSITYAANSTIIVHLAGRNVRDGERIIAWETPPEGVKFVLDEESRGKSRCCIVMAEDGLYVQKGMVLFIR